MTHLPAGLWLALRLIVLETAYGAVLIAAHGADGWIVLSVH